VAENSIADMRGDQILATYKASREEEKKGRLRFSSKISELKKVL
jgi:hypothetical protein